MADLIIRGMKMPKTCVQCDLKIYDPEKRWNENGIEQIGAWVCKRTGEVIWNTQRGEDCPLVPLPEGHGRLIDADALNLDYEVEMADDWKTVHEIANAVKYALTIVPAEGVQAMTKEEYEKNKGNMTPWRCDNGHVYMVFKNSCVFCEHCDVFWDYTNGPYLFLCDADRNTEHGLLGQCEMFKKTETGG